jgi:hypothetical protein
VINSKKPIIKKIQSTTRNKIKIDKKISPKKSVESPVNEIEDEIEKKLKNLEGNNLKSKSKSNESFMNQISDDDDEVSWEEVEENEDELYKTAKVNAQPVQFLFDKKKNKKVDMEAKIERMKKALMKKLYLFTLKSHLLCWIGHGFYLNKVYSHPLVHATLLSMNEFNFDNNLNTDTAGLTTILSKLNEIFNKNCKLYSLESIPINTLCTPTKLSESIGNLKFNNYLEYILACLAILRNNTKFKVRLSICFEVISPEDFENNNKKKKSKEETTVESVTEPQEIKNHKILSSDESDNNIDNNIKYSYVQHYRNYWIEVYLIDKNCWVPVEPMSAKIDCANFLEERYRQPVLYVCSFDIQNETIGEINYKILKDVTSRYADEFCTTTRVNRIDHIEKKLWWEKVLLKFQTNNIQMDMKENLQLKGELKFNLATKKNSKIFFNFFSKFKRNF